MEAELDLDRDDAARVRRGDLTGLEGLMGRHQERVYRYLRRLLGDEAVADDIFQQTWVRVAERIGRYDASRPFRPWVLSVAHNLAYDHLRRREPGSLEESHVPEPASAGDEETDDPLARLAGLERSQRLAAAVGELSPADREVIGLRFEQDLELAELADVLGVPLSTAKARLYRSLRRLGRRLLAQGPREEWT
jgi:RNA polymerase sigma-70 factor (ECF subfamily)